jgi:hypothetical protein
MHGAVPLALLYMPAAHSVHVSPCGPEYPVLHVQAARAELDAGEYEPSGHAVHVPPFAPVKPALHVQAARVEPLGAIELAGQPIHCVAAVSEYVAAAQSMHAEEPLALLYLPATQAAQAPSGPVYPAPHFAFTQAATAVLAAGDVVKVGHGVHAAAPVSTL